MQRQDLVRRYLALQDEARAFGLTGTAHITRDMSDAEIVRLGKMLAQQVAEVKTNGKENGRQPSADS